ERSRVRAFVFFFSSRRRHTRFSRDWSSDVCSSDLKLTGKLHVAVGDMDDYYLNEAVYLMQAALDSLSDPPARASFEYGRRMGHCWIGYSRERPGEDLDYAEFVRLAADHMARNAPPGADLRWAR